MGLYNQHSVKHLKWLVAVNVQYDDKRAKNTLSFSLSQFSSGLKPKKRAEMIINANGEKVNSKLKQLDNRRLFRSLSLLSSLSL